MRYGAYPKQPKFPFVPGYDAFGLIESVGAGVKGLEPGQAVAALTQFGGYAQFVVAKAHFCIVVPDGLNPIKVTALILNYTAAWQMMHRLCKLKKRDRILIHAAGGGVGTALVQLGANMGLEMYGTASLSKHEALHSMGVSPIDYRTQNFVTTVHRLSIDGVHAVFDPIGGAHLYSSFEALRSRGKMVAYGIISGVGKGKSGGLAFFWTVLALIWCTITGLGLKKVEFYSIMGPLNKHPEYYREDMAKLLQLLEEDQIDPIIAEVVTLDQVPRIHEQLETGHLTGKVVIKMS
jgi:NADPH2:quinone reductase